MAQIQVRFLLSDNAIFSTGWDRPIDAGVTYAVCVPLNVSRSQKYGYMIATDTVVHSAKVTNVLKVLNDSVRGISRRVTWKVPTHDAEHHGYCDVSPTWSYSFVRLFYDRQGITLQTNIKFPITPTEYQQFELPHFFEMIKSFIIRNNFSHIICCMKIKLD